MKNEYSKYIYMKKLSQCTEKSQQEWASLLRYNSLYSVAHSVYACFSFGGKIGILTCLCVFIPQPLQEDAGTIPN